ncbi:hypothetical protein EJF36_08185 [Bacillus sp. HMF5848]|uniref:hypothetical protein n=1 Tax=Bacillus sp. HMF5848 TaxID=2495421 RepID=UPI000F796C0A|nr:hypothetical protein [Bacillus sp. HMF5848]RSK26843.1 hypothetical protein EJF36_08185 [Bacillus sp. HMF5848]
MGYVTMILAVIGIIILGFGLVMTYRIGGTQERQETNLDTAVGEKVRNHAAVRNPIFLTYILLAVLMFIYISYMSLSK